MQTYLKFKNEIAGLKDVAETVKSTEKIAAAQIHFLKSRVQNLILYTQNISYLLKRLIVFYQNSSNILLINKKRGDKMILVVSGNKGLVGGLYHNLVQALSTHHHYQKIVVIGIKGRRYLQEANFPIENVFTIAGELPTPQEVQAIANYLFVTFKDHNISQIDILYPHFVSLVVQEPKITQFLPFSFTDGFTSTAADLSQTNLGFPIFDPSKKKNFNWLLEKYIEVSFYRLILEAKLSEFSARTMTAEHATLKTKDLIRKTQLEYFKERRRTITQKQLESFMVHHVNR